MRRSHAIFRIVLVIGLVLPARHAAAGDFWDEVREPGISAYRAHVRRAQAAIGARQFDDALRAADVAVELLPDRADGHAVRGVALAERNRPAEAADSIARAISIDVGAYDDPLLGSRAAYLMARNGRPDLSAQVLARLLMRMRASPTRRSLFALYGDVLQQLGPAHVAQAARAYREAMRTGLRDSRSLLGLALALRRSGEREEADTLARQAVAPGALDDMIRQLPVSVTERAARRAVAAEASGETAVALRAWAEARADPVWAEWVQSEALDAGRGVRRARRTR